MKTIWSGIFQNSLQDQDLARSLLLGLLIDDKRAWSSSEGKFGVEDFLVTQQEPGAWVVFCPLICLVTFIPK